MFNEQNLNDKSLKELLAIYNDESIRGNLPERTKFRDKSSAIKLILHMQAQNSGSVPEAGAPGEASAGSAAPEGTNMKKNAGKKTKKKEVKKAKTPRKPAGERKTRERKPFDLAPSKAIKEHRDGTARAKAIAVLKKGATFAEVQQATGWKLHRHCYEGIRLLNTHLGYGVKEDDKGTIRLVTK